MSSDEELPKLSRWPDREEIEQLISSKRLSDDTLCKFVHLHKGVWTYKFMWNGDYHYINGGEATHEAAYSLELDCEERLGSLLGSVE